jgi:hypothetical protein
MSGEVSFEPAANSTLAHIILSRHSLSSKGVHMAGIFDS